MKRHLIFCLLTPVAGISIAFGKKGKACKNCDISAPDSYKNAYGKAFPEKKSFPPYQYPRLVEEGAIVRVDKDVFNNPPKERGLGFNSSRSNRPLESRPESDPTSGIRIFNPGKYTSAYLGSTLSVQGWQPNDESGEPWTKINLNNFGDYATFVEEGVLYIVTWKPFMNGSKVTVIDVAEVNN